QPNGGGALGGRGVVAVETGEAAGVEAAQDLRGLRRDGLEVLLDDLLAGGPNRLAQEDVGDARRVAGVVVAAARLLGELAQDVARSTARADRREGDAGGLHVVEQLV